MKTKDILFKVTRTASGNLRRFECWGCSVKTTRKHSTYSYPCCEACEDAFDAHQACHLTQGQVAFSTR